MENKYYTPEIEEFHIGFEYEEKSSGLWTCNCQGYQSKLKRGEITGDGVACSHILALFYAFKMKKFGNSQGATQKQMEIDKYE